jgi:hypothetical protein
MVSVLDEISSIQILGPRLSLLQASREQGSLASGQEEPTEGPTRHREQNVIGAASHLDPALGDRHRLIPMAGHGEAGDNNQGRPRAGPLTGAGSLEDIEGHGDGPGRLTRGEQNIRSHGPQPIYQRWVLDVLLGPQKNGLCLAGLALPHPQQSQGSELGCDGSLFFVCAELIEASEDVLTVFLLCEERQCQHVAGGDTASRLGTSPGQPLGEGEIR